MEYVHDVFHSIQIDFIARLLYGADRLERNNKKFKLLFIHLIIIIIIQIQYYYFERVFV